MAVAAPSVPGSPLPPLIEIYDQDGKPLRTRAIEVFPASIPGSDQTVPIRVRVTLTGSPKAKGEVLVRQIEGSEVAPFYGRLVSYDPGQVTIELECHVVLKEGKTGSLVVQAMLTGSHLAKAGAVSAELKVSDPSK